MKIRLASRQSDLAKVQAYAVGAALAAAQPESSIEYQFRESLGDQNQNDPLWKMPEKGVFTEDFYRDLVERKTDLVVHSWKDLPVEKKAHTEIVASLVRADQRDLLLFKKSSRGKRNLKFYSSSPRRSFNLQEFFSWALPWQTDHRSFIPVRGNIPTRVRKLLEDPDIDGLILAKAAIDRLLQGEQFLATKGFLRDSLHFCDWMVLPLSENPNAAAQGALAIEIHQDNIELKKILQDLHCSESFKTAQREREILSGFGGGCHMALGVSCLSRPYGWLEIVRGQTPEGHSFSKKDFYPQKAVPTKYLRARLDFVSSRQTKPVDIQELDAVFVARAEAFPRSVFFSGLVWVAGMTTWKKLAQQGVWVHGSAEGLGEQEDPRVAELLGFQARWGRLTHDHAADLVSARGAPLALKSYQLDLKLKSPSLPEADIFSWRSAGEFLLAIETFPQLMGRRHICGPGRSFEVIKERLGSDENLFVELNDGFSTTF